jgi:uncharacterized membrane protein
LPLADFSSKVIGRVQERYLIPPEIAEWIPGFSWGVWLPYLMGALVLVIGLITVRNEFLQKRGLDKIVVLGPVFFAVPLAVFGTEHFTAATILAGMVPAWLPGHMFWALFVGACLIAAALSIAARKYAWLASALTGVLILLFVLLIHIPNVVGNPHTRIIWVVALREPAFAGGAFALAATQEEGWKPQVRHAFATLARFFIAIPIAFMGVQQCLHPELAPGVPLAMSTPLWVPAHSFWGYLTGAIYVVIAISLLLNKQVRLAATWLGLIILVLVLFLYLPIVIANPADIANGLNYLADTLLLCGAVLALAGTRDQNSS